MGLMNRILFFFYNLVNSIKDTWLWLGDYLETNEFLLEILYFVGLVIIGTIIVRLIMNLLDRF